MLLIHRSSNLLIYFHFLTQIMVLVIYKHLISAGGNTLNLRTAGGFQMTVVSCVKLEEFQNGGQN